MEELRLFLDYTETPTRMSVAERKQFADEVLCRVKELAHAKGIELRVVRDGETIWTPANNNLFIDDLLAGDLSRAE